MPGTIYLVATPLGNLEDITLRALRVLKEADAIACEDTRHTGRLLRHFEISKPLVSYHEHNEAERAAELVERAREGESIAVVSDAGMPGISDPGYRIVEQAIAVGVNVVPVPGPVAIETALAASGLPTDSFRFGGFLPARRAQRRDKVSRGRPRSREHLKRLNRHPRAPIGDAFARIGDDPFEHGAGLSLRRYHWHCPDSSASCDERSTNSSSLRSARPSSMHSAARLTPSATVGTSSAANSAAAALSVTNPVRAEVLPPSTSRIIVAASAGVSPPRTASIETGRI